MRDYHAMFLVVDILIFRKTERLGRAAQKCAIFGLPELQHVCAG